MTIRSRRMEDTSGPDKNCFSGMRKPKFDQKGFKREKMREQVEIVVSRSLAAKTRKMGQ